MVTSVTPVACASAAQQTHSTAASPALQEMTKLEASHSNGSRSSGSFLSARHHFMTQLTQWWWQH